MIFRMASVAANEYPTVTTTSTACFPTCAKLADAPAALIERCLGPDERTALASLPTAAQSRRFVELWTLKEAYIKARGLGLSLPLERIGLTLDDGVPRLALDPSLDDDAASWQLALWSPNVPHAAALCVRRGGGPPLTIDSRWLAG